MAIEVESPPVTAQAAPRAAWQRRLGRDWVLAYVLLIPLVLTLFILLAYPIASAIWITLQDKTIGMVGRFIGLGNYRELLFDDPFFWQVVRNGFVFTVGSVFLKLIVGMIMALVLNQPLRWRGLWRGLLLMPWVAPTVVTALSWRWILDLTGVLNLTLRDLGLMGVPIPWLAQYGTALLSLVLVNTWRGFPFFGITLLAGMQAIPQELYEAAEMDGASIWQRFRFVTLPSLRTVILVVTILSLIWTFNDFSITTVLINCTNLYGSLMKIYV